MSIEAAVQAKLLSLTALTALCSTRIWGGRLPDNSSFPAVSWQIISSQHSYNVGDVGELRSVLIQIDCRANTHADSLTMAAAINAGLDGFKGAIGSVNVVAIFHEDEQDFQEPEIPVFRRILEFTITYSE